MGPVDCLKHDDSHMIVGASMCDVHLAPAPAHHRQSLSHGHVLFAFQCSGSMGIIQMLHSHLYGCVDGDVVFDAE